LKLQEFAEKAEKPSGSRFNDLPGESHPSTPKTPQNET
jgi:hypothetical protein